MRWLRFLRRAKVIGRNSKVRPPLGPIGEPTPAIRYSGRRTIIGQTDARS